MIDITVDKNGKKDGNTPEFSVLSGGDWTASCDANWVKLGKTSGGATGGTATKVLVDIDPNDSGDTRTATITVKATRKQVGTITIQQGKN